MISVVVDFTAIVAVRKNDAALQSLQTECKYTTKELPTFGSPSSKYCEITEKGPTPAAFHVEVFYSVYDFAIMRHVKKGVGVWPRSTKLFHTLHIGTTDKTHNESMQCCDHMAVKLGRKGDQTSEKLAPTCLMDTVGRKQERVTYNRFLSIIEYREGLSEL